MCVWFPVGKLRRTLNETLGSGQGIGGYYNGDDSGLSMRGYLVAPKGFDGMTTFEVRFGGKHGQYRVRLVR